MNAVSLAQQRQIHRSQHPPVGRALRSDGVAYAANRGERFHFKSSTEEWLNVARLIFSSADFCGMALYRVRTLLVRHHVPVLPSLLSHLMGFLFKLRIGADVLIQPGVYIPHGTVVIDGVTSIGSGCVLTPWVAITPRTHRERGPTLEAGVFVGSHASIVGEIMIGRASQIGAGAVVLHSVPAGSVVVGVPGRVLAAGRPGRLEATDPIEGLP
jgi:serine O-acetyltransferase